MFTAVAPRRKPQRRRAPGAVLSPPSPLRQPGRERRPYEERKAEEAERQREHRYAAHDGAAARADADPVAAGEARSGPHGLDARHGDVLARLAGDTAHGA